VFQTKANEFLVEVVQYSGAEKIKTNQDYQKKQIEVYMIGASVPETIIQNWRQHMGNIEALKEATLVVHQGTSETGDVAMLTNQVRSGILEDLYVKNQEVIQDKDLQIQFLKNELAKHKQSNFSFQAISKEVKINYGSVEKISFSNLVSTNFSEIDTVPTFAVTWKNNLSTKVKTAEAEKLHNWLRLRLDLENLVVESVN
jgi:acyl-CoA synthetase (AMP-forming)/AMP-acid ligase II